MTHKRRNKILAYIQRAIFNMQQETTAELKRLDPPIFSEDESDLKIQESGQTVVIFSLSQTSINISIEVVKSIKIKSINQNQYVLSIKCYLQSFERTLSLNMLRSR